ncbi:putative MHC class II antigen protein, partial [Naja naja]
HFLYQYKAECLFLNGTQRVRYLQRYIYDRQEMSASTATSGNLKAEVDRFCRHNYEALNFEAAKREESVVGRRKLRNLLFSQDPNSPPVRDLGSL